MLEEKLTYWMASVNFLFVFDPRRYFLQHDDKLDELLDEFQLFNVTTDPVGENVWVSVSSSFLWLFCEGFA